MIDGSIIRVAFSFDDDYLVSENLLWCPSPFSDNADMLDCFTPQELLDDLYGDSNWYEQITMRTPIRIDFDASRHENKHTAAHVHFQHHDTHIDVIRPICFNRFIDFIFYTCYPLYSVSFKNVDYIDYKIKELPRIDEQQVQLRIM